MWISHARFNLGDIRSSYENAPGFNGIGPVPRRSQSIPGNNPGDESGIQSFGKEAGGLYAVERARKRMPE